MNRLSACIAFLLVVIPIGMVPGTSRADERGLNVLRSPIYGFKSHKADDGKAYAAGTGTTFYIIACDENNTLVVFDDAEEILKAPDLPGKTYEKVTTDKIYEIQTPDLPKAAYRMRWGLSHGPLVVPFKFRTNDGSLSGEATLGYYLGVKSETILVSGTAFISAGLALIPVSDVNSSETETKTGFSWAVGYAFETKTNFQAAIVAGGDHLGGTAGDNWEYEDDIWLSLAIGFNFMN